MTVAEARQSLDSLPGGIVLAALFAPVAVWVLWRLQVYSVELLRWRMTKLLRHAKWLYNAVSWIGTLLHEMSHATVLLLSGHGIKQFRVRSDSGHVLPRRMRKGPVGFLFFLVAALAPLFGPPLLALAALVWLVDRHLMPFTAPGPGLGAALGAMHDLAVAFPARLGKALGALDVTDPWHAAAVLVVLLGMPGSRPSHVKGSRFHGEKDEGDVAVVRKRIRGNPWPLLVFVALLVAAYYPLTRWAPKVYWYPFEAVWAVALTAILLALFGALWWSSVAWTTRIRWWLAWIPVALLVGGQYLGRAWEWPLTVTNGASVGAFAAGALVLATVAARKTRVGKLRL